MDVNKQGRRCVERDRATPFRRRSRASSYTTANAFTESVYRAYCDLSAKAGFALWRSRLCGLNFIDWLPFTSFSPLQVLYNCAPTFFETLFSKMAVVKIEDPSIQFCVWEPKSVTVVVQLQELQSLTLPGFGPLAAA
jgi:hypothetical protein